MNPPPQRRRPSPLRPVDLQVLLALRHGTRHGYGLVSDVREQSGDRLRLAPASLYTVLQRLLDWGWIAEAEGDDDSGGPPRRSYRLTRAGRAALDDEALRLRELMAQLDPPAITEAERRR